MNSAVTVCRISSIQSDLLPVDFLSPFFFFRTLEYDTRRGEGKQKGEVWMGLISVFSELIDITCMSEHTNTTKKQEVGLDVNEEEK